MEGALAAPAGAGLGFSCGVGEAANPEPDFAGPAGGGRLGIVGDELCKVLLLDPGFLAAFKDATLGFEEATAVMLLLDAPTALPLLTLLLTAVVDDELLLMLLLLLLLPTLLAVPALIRLEALLPLMLALLGATVTALLVEADKSLAPAADETDEVDGFDCAGTPAADDEACSDATAAMAVDIAMSSVVREWRRASFGLLMRPSSFSSASRSEKSASLF